MTTWVPLAVALAVALISAVGSYITALHMNSRAARQELQATKRTTYAKALGDLEAGHAVLHSAALRRSKAEETIMGSMAQLFESPTRLSDEEVAKVRLEARTRMAEALAQIMILGGPELRDALDEVETMSRRDWLDEGRPRLVHLMVRDLAEGDRPRRRVGQAKPEKLPSLSVSTDAEPLGSTGDAEFLKSVTPTDSSTSDSAQDRP